MRGLSISLESQQTPSVVNVSWRSLQNLAVLAPEGGSPGDLDFRFKMNRILRSTRNAAPKIAVLRKSKGASVAFTGKVLDLDSLRTALWTYSERLEAIRGEQRSLCVKYEIPIPNHLKNLSPVPEFKEPANPFSIFEEGDAVQGLTKKGRRLLTLSAVTKQQEGMKALKTLDDEVAKLASSKKLLEDTIQSSSRTLARRLKETELGFRKEHPESPDCDLQEVLASVRGEAPAPVIISPVHGLVLEYTSSMSILEPDYARLAAFLDRNGSKSLWFAPQIARDEKGTLQPLSQRYRSLCEKNLTQPPMLKSINNELREALAWRWLIISHNHCCTSPSQKVPLPPKLSVAYQRQQERSGPSKASANKADEALKEMVRGFLETVKASSQAPKDAEQSYPQGQVEKFLHLTLQHLKWSSGSYATWDEDTGRFSLKDGKSQFLGHLTRLNTLISAADELSVGKDIMGTSFIPEPPPELVLLVQPAPSTAETDADSMSVHSGGSDELAAREELSNNLWLRDHPESFDKDGLVYFREDIDFVDISEGQSFAVLVHNGVRYYAMHGEVTGPPKSARAAGKTGIRPPPPTAPPIPGNKPGRKDKKKEDALNAGVSQPPTAQENPLHVKGEPKTKALSDGQRETLRTFFKLKKDLVPSEEWAKLDNRQKAAAMKERSIPRWATESVLRDPASLQYILEGRITSENANQVPRSLSASRTKNGARATEAWLQLKSDFKGVPLLRNPSTGRERALKKRFDQLVVDYGEQPGFPKPKENPAHQGQGSSGRGGRPSQGGTSDLVLMMKTMGEFARAFSGK